MPKAYNTGLTSIIKLIDILFAPYFPAATIPDQPDVLSRDPASYEQYGIALENLLYEIFQRTHEGLAFFDTY